MIEFDKDTNEILDVPGAEGMSWDKLQDVSNPETNQLIEEEIIFAFRVNFSTFLLLCISIPSIIAFFCGVIIADFILTSNPFFIAFTDKGCLEHKIIESKSI